MGNYELLKAAINEVIKANGRQEITGEVLNQVLLSMVNSLGAGYQCMGVATPSTNPGTPDQNVFYFATQAGTYTNFDAIVLQAGISVLIWDGDWASQTWFTVDSTPTNNSQNLIASGAVFNALKLDGGAYDVSAHNSGATFASLSALLNSDNLNTLIPTEIRHGGMSIKFVQSSENKYIQARCMAQEFTTDVTKWQGVDETPTPASQNLVESGGAAQINTIEILAKDNSVIYESIYPSDGTAPDTDYILVELNLGAAYGTLYVDLATRDDSSTITTTIYNGAGVVGRYAWKVPYNGERFIRFYVSSNSYPANSSFRISYPDVVQRLWGESLDVLNLPKAIDNEPTDNSNNYVKSGGVKNAIDNVNVKIGKQNVNGSIQGDGVSPWYLVGGTDKIGIYVNDYYFMFKINSGTATNWRSRIFYSDSETADYDDVVDGKTYGNGTRKILGVSIYLLQTLTTLESLDVDVISGLTFVDEQQGKQITDLNEKSVKITNQSFTNAQKGIARGNIGAASQADLQTLEELFPQHNEWEVQDKTTGIYALVPNQVSGSVGNRVKNGILYGSSSSKTLTSLVFEIDKTKRYKLKAKIGRYNDGLAFYENSDGTGYVGNGGWGVPEASPEVTKEEELTIPDNANYMRIATIDSDIFEFSIYNDDYIPVASQEDVDDLDDRVDQNESDILTLYGIVSGSDVPPENAVKYVPTKTLYLGTDVLDISNVTYNSTYWTVENGLPKYLGGGGSGTTFKFNAATIEGARYLAQIETLTQDGKYEGLFYIRIGDGPIVDTYNGGRNTIGGLVSDGGQFEIVPYGINPFDVTGLTLKQCFQSDQAAGYAETKVITVDNVDAGNSAATLIDGKWNVAIGPTGSTMAHNVNGSRSIGIGLAALQNWFSGWQNIGIGTYALTLLEEGNRNIAIGCDALWQTKKANDNVGIGHRALSNTGVYDEISNNVAVGTQACGNNQAATQNTVAIGYSANRYGVKESVFIGSNCTTFFVNRGISHAIAIGYMTRANRDNQILIGHNVLGTNPNQVIIGNSENIEFRLGSRSDAEYILGNKRLIFNQDGTVSWEQVVDIVVDANYEDLSKFTYSNNDRYITINSAYQATISVANGYHLVFGNTATRVLMGGINITADVFDAATNTININSATGNITVVVKVEPDV